MPSEGRLTAAQTLIWHLHRTASRPEALNMFYALEIEGELDGASLERALRAMVRRHDPLRTSYPAVAGAPVPRIHRGDRLDWARVELHGAPKESLRRAARLAAEEAGHRFDLERDRLLRARLMTLSPRRWILLLNFHHILADGWSLDLFTRQTSDLYAAFRSRVKPPRESPELPCPDHAARQAAWLNGPEARRQAAWWRKHLQAVAPSAARLPADGNSGTPPEARLLRRVLPLPRELVEELQKMARRRGASLFALLLAAVEVLLCRWAGLEDIVVGTLAAHRDTAASASLLGAHYNPILLRTRLDPGTALGEVLMRAVESSLASLDHQELPFVELCRLLAAETPSLARGPLPAVLVLLDRFPLAGLVLDGVRVTPLHLDREGAGSAAGFAAPHPVHALTRGDLVFFHREHAGSYTLSLFYRPERFDDATAEALAGAYLEVLLAMTDDLGRTVGDLDLPLPAGASRRRRTPRLSPAADDPSLLPADTVSPVDALSPVGGLADGGSP